MSDERPRILFLAHLLPFPLDGGAKIKSYYTLKALASEYDVTLVAFIRSASENQYVKELRPYCVGGVQTVIIKRSRVRNVVDAIRAFVTRSSFIIVRDKVREMQKVVKERLEKQRYAAVHIDHLQMVQYVVPRKSGARLILDHHNIESVIIRRIAQTSESPWMRNYANLEAPKLERYEIQACRECDHVLTVTDEDSATLKSLSTDDISVTTIPIGVDGQYYVKVQRKSNSLTLLSVGTMYWQPNIDAMLWFTDVIYPKIKEMVPDVRLNIVGNRPPNKILSLTEGDPSISVSGYVDDDRECAMDCAAFIVPLLAGGGMRVKILNALSMGLPIVSTRVGAEGIGVTDGKDIFIANNPDRFAAACVNLLRDPLLRDKIGGAGRHLVETYYSWESISRRLLTVYAHVLSTSTRPKSKVAAKN